MSIFDKLRFLFSGVHFRHVYKKLKHSLRYGFGREYIRLAVVGTTSSGKSFLLQDILTSLKSMSGIYHPLENGLQEFKDFGNYSPDEFGGDGGTPLYSCRQGNHYGSAMKHNNNTNAKYDMDFLNIPGEIFAEPKSGVSRLQAFTKLRDKLRKTSKVFSVTLWMSDTGEQKWIVEPNNAAAPTAADRAAMSSINPKTLVTSFKTWAQIFSELNEGKYKPVKGSAKRINGADLLKHFFEYDTDSVIRSIQEWIRTRNIADLGFDADDFQGNAYDRSFVFFHYCSLATDIVICDRIFTSEKPEDEMSFGELINGINSFMKDSSESDELHVYLAFRNVDFIMYPKEANYQKLNSETLSQVVSTKRHNAIYSLFTYAMQHYINRKLEIKRDLLSEFIGMPEEKILAPGVTDAITPDGVTDNADKLVDALLDVSGGSGFLKEDQPDLYGHIKSRLGGNDGQGFRLLLTRTRTKKGDENLAVGTIVPHVYFSCTPITCEYDIYQNYNVGGRPAPDFKKTIKGKDYYFSNCNSKVCFGSYQLTMDILVQHGLGNFIVGDLLRIMQGKHNS